jgi:CRISPR-associated endonuclease Cas1
MTAQAVQRTPRKTRRSHPGTPHLVVDGYGVRLSVRRGRLVIEDGMGTHRHRRELSRIERTIRRIVILTDTGTVSLEAIRWCADVGIAVVQLDRDGRPLLSATAPGTDDARLRRAQAAASSSPLGLQITRDLLGAKLAGQAAVARDLLNHESIAERLDTMAAQMETTVTLSACRDLEAQGAQMYFGAWAANVSCRFAEKERPKVPEHWASFTTRKTIIAHTATTRPAATPINALLNYGYGIAEIECRLAAITVGLDPGMGIVHTDKKNRDSLALDLLEAIRPLVERNVLTLLATRHFVAGDFYETRDGNCQLVSPLTQLLVDAMPSYATAIAPITEALAHDLARSSPGRIELSTRLTRANITHTRISGTRLNSGTPTPSAASMLTCRSCGIPLTGSARKLCSTCWPLIRDAEFKTRRKATAVGRATAREAGIDPTSTPEALAKRRQSALAVKAAEAAWAATGSRNPISEEQMNDEVLPRLQQVTVRQMQDATGLSSTACSMIRSGKRTAHPRHWAALAGLVSSLPAG